MAMSFTTERRESNRFQYYHSNSPTAEIFYDGDSSSLSSDNASSPFYLSLSEAIDSDNEEEAYSSLTKPKAEEPTAKKLTVRFEEASLKKDEQENNGNHDSTLPSDSNEENNDVSNSSDSDSSYHKEYVAKKRVKQQRRKKRIYPSKIENRVIWTPEMMNDLLDGVNTCGRGRWKEIWKKYDFPSIVTITKVASKWHYMTRRNLVARVGTKWILTCQMEDLMDKTPTSRKGGSKPEEFSSSEEDYSPPLKKKAKRPAKPPIYWSLDMINTLVDAVNDCGKGRWSEIVSKYHFPFELSAKKIGDKWTHLARNNYVKCENNRWILSDFLKDGNVDEI